MRMGEKNYAVSNDGRNEGRPGCMVAIKEIKVPYTKTQYSFSIHLMRPHAVDQLFPNSIQCTPKKSYISKTMTRKCHSLHLSLKHPPPLCSLPQLPYLK